MQQRTRSVLRLIFLVVGTSSAMLWIGTLALITLLQPLGDHSEALRGSFIYLAIALVSLAAVWRLRPAKRAGTGFDVIVKQAPRN